jgi:hypothetical protein
MTTPSIDERQKTLEDGLDSVVGQLRDSIPQLRGGLTQAFNRIAALEKRVKSLEDGAPTPAQARAR